MKKIKILLIAVMVIGAGFLSGCNEINRYETDKESEGEDYGEQYDILEFLDFTSDTSQTINYYNTKIKAEIDLGLSANWYTIEYYTELQQDAIEKGQREINDFYLSYEYERIRQEFDEHLDDYWWHAYYMLKACDCMTDYPKDYSGATDYIELATSYLKKATAHLSKCTDMIEGLTPPL